MIGKKVFFYIILLYAQAVCSSVMAQDDSLRLSRLLRIDRHLKEKYARVDYDTLYIGRPSELLTLRVRGNMSGTAFRTYGKRDGRSMHGHLQSDYQKSMSLDIGYCGLTLGLTVNPASLRGKNRDEEFNLNYYDNHFGFDVVYQSVKSFQGYMNYLGERHDMPKGDVSMDMVNVNAYYVFNGKRFSYPAAFDHTYIQKHSAGSWLAGMSYQGGRLRHSTTKADDQQSTSRFYSGYLAIGGGYAYNWGIHRRWLIHASALPSLIIVNRSNIRVDDTRQDAKSKFPDAITTERLAVVRNIHHYFAGATFVMTNTLLGDNKARITFSKWNSQVIFGIRF